MKHSTVVLVICPPRSRFRVLNDHPCKTQLSETVVKQCYYHLVRQ